MNAKKIIANFENDIIDSFVKNDEVISGRISREEAETLPRVCDLYRAFTAYAKILLQAMQKDLPTLKQSLSDHGRVGRDISQTQKIASAALTIEQLNIWRFDLSGNENTWDVYTTHLDNIISYRSGEKGFEFEYVHDYQLDSIFLIDNAYELLPEPMRRPFNRSIKSGEMDL